jgi:hypothetical protein
MPEWNRRGAQAGIAAQVPARGPTMIPVTIPAVASSALPGRPPAATLNLPH